VAVHESEGGPLMFAKSVELADLLAGAVVRVEHAAVARAIGINRGIVDVAIGGVADGERHDAIGAVGDVDGVQRLHVMGRAADSSLGTNEYVKSVCARIDDRSGCDADFNGDVVTCRCRCWGRS